MKTTAALIAFLVVASGVVVPATVGGSEANEPPLADAGLDQQVRQGATVLLDATGSRDPDGQVANYPGLPEPPTMPENPFDNTTLTYSPTPTAEN